MTSTPDLKDARPSQAHGTNVRGQQRRQELLQTAVDYLLTDGLQDFSVRQVAKRAGTTHRIVLYHFESTDKLLREALTEIRRPFLARAEVTPDLRELAQEVFADDSPAERVLLQGLLLAGLDPDRYADIGRDYTATYLPSVKRRLPSHITGRARDDLAELVLCAFRGALLDAHTTGDPEPARRALAMLQTIVAGSPE